MNFYQEEINDVLDNLKTSIEGLSQLEAKERLKRYGKNELPKKKTDGILTIFLRQLKDVVFQHHRFLVHVIICLGIAQNENKD